MTGEVSSSPLWRKKLMGEAGCVDVRLGVRIHLSQEILDLRQLVMHVTQGSISKDRKVL